MSTVFYVASIVGIVLMYYLYAPKMACALNIFFITWTAILLVVMMVISLHPLVCSSEYHFSCLYMSQNISGRKG